MPDFVALATLVAVAMLIWDCVEVGRNDAANLVNAVFGARVLSRQRAVIIAAVAVVLGATFSAPVMETARKGIFDPTVLSLQMAIAIYVSVYFVDTLLLFGFSGYGMPVSTTACLVFELVGASLFLAGPDKVNWGKVGSVTEAIVVSIIISGVASFMVMRAFRGTVRGNAQDRDTVLLHGPWIAGAMLTWLTWFMVFKGLNHVPIVETFRNETFEAYGDPFVLLTAWGGYTLLVHLFFVIGNGRGYSHLFSATAVLGMICMAFAFGQNDLANAASPGLAVVSLWRHADTAGEGARVGTEVAIPIWMLFGCGALMASGMFTRYAQRVTRAEVNTGSQFDEVALYAPEWCKSLARAFLRFRGEGKVLAPQASLSDSGKKVHYDTLRASVITGVSASVIAFASGQGLPVSTTYVSFAAVLGTGLSDRVFARGNADTKMGRAIWVIACWFIAPVIAIVATGCVALIVYNLKSVGLVTCIVLNLIIRQVFRRRADLHEQMSHSTKTSHDATSKDATSNDSAPRDSDTPDPATP
ncbi:MAG: inorganic phosphate transporter [Pirellulales bacterium]